MSFKVFVFYVFALHTTLLDMLFQKRFVGLTQNRLEEYCGMISNLQLTALTYGMRPMPYVGSIDLASAFFSAERLLQEKMFFGTFRVCFVLCHVHCAFFVLLFK